MQNTCVFGRAVACPRKMGACIVLHNSYLQPMSLNQSVTDVLDSYNMGWSIIREGNKKGPTVGLDREKP